MFSALNWIRIVSVMTVLMVSFDYHFFFCVEKLNLKLLQFHAAIR